MIIVTERKTPKQEAGNISERDITWKEVLGIANALSGRKGVDFLEVGSDRPPLGNQPIVGLKAFGSDLLIYGKQTGYVIFGNQVKRVVLRHFEPSKAEGMVFLFSPYKELALDWTN
jgi:hypothetical protein